MYGHKIVEAGGETATSTRTFSDRHSTLIPSCNSCEALASSLRQDDLAGSFYAAVLDSSSPVFPSRVYFLILQSHVWDQYALVADRRVQEMDWLEIDRYLKDSEQKLQRKKITILHPSETLPHPRQTMQYASDSIKVYLQDARPCACIWPDDSFGPVWVAPREAWEMPELVFRQQSQDRGSGSIAEDLNTLDTLAEIPSRAKLCIKYSTEHEKYKGATGDYFIISFQVTKSGMFGLGITPCTKSEARGAVDGEITPVAARIVPRTTSIMERGQRCLFEYYPLDLRTEVHVKTSHVKITGCQYWSVEVTIALRSSKLRRLRLRVKRKLERYRSTRSNQLSTEDGQRSVSEA